MANCQVEFFYLQVKLPLKYTFKPSHHWESKFVCMFIFEKAITLFLESNVDEK